MCVRRRATLPLVLAALVTAGLFGAPASALGQAGSIHGTVVAEDGGAPLPAALVALDGTPMSAVTGPDGTFAIDGVPAGAYRLTVTGRPSRPSPRR